jgi:hypothetical protein
LNQDHENTQVNCFPPVWPGTTRPELTSWLAGTSSHDPAERVTADYLLAGIQNGLPMHCFSGGNGAMYRETNFNNGKGGVIIIADEIEVTENAIVNRMNPVEGADFVGNPSDGPSGGGMMVLVGNTVSVDSSAQFEAALESTPSTTDNHRTVAQMDVASLAVPASGIGTGAGNGQLFTIDLGTGIPTRLF